MTTKTITVRARRPEIEKIIRSLPNLARGHGGRGLLIRVGLTALDLIKKAFVVKSHGGQDEAGERWQPLSPATIAYSRRHKKTSRKKRGGVRPSGALTEIQRQKWWAHYRHFLGKLKGNKAHAAACAWVILKRSGVVTLMQKYGGTQVDILRDTGLLLRSLTPKVPADAAPTNPPRNPHQVFRTSRGEVIIGTNRDWAYTHHYGIRGRLPRRRLWPHPSRWPAAWWDQILVQARAGLIDLLLHTLGKS